MIRALRGDNIEEIIEDVVRRETAPRFRDLSYNEFLSAFEDFSSIDARVTKIVCEPKTFRYLIQKYLEWSSDDVLVQQVYQSCLTLMFNGATFGVSTADKWQVGKIYFRDGNRTLGWLDVLDSPQADLESIVSVATSSLPAMSVISSEPFYNPNDPPF